MQLPSVAVDVSTLRADPERVRASQRARGEDVALVERVLAVDERFRAARRRADELRAEQKRRSPEMRTLTGDERDRLREALGALSEQAKAADAEADALAGEREAAMAELPNLVEGAPPGGEDDFVVLETVGEPPRFESQPRDHVELGQLLGAIDLERGAKVSGSRFYFLTGVGALLELALVNLAVRMAMGEGFSPMIPPVLVRPEAMAGTGFLGSHADEVYRLAADDLYLVGTSEVPMAAFHADEIIPAAEMPKRYVGFSSCFRREAGAAGRDTRGIIRVHQFEKVEMFVHCQLEDADAEHQRLLGIERRFLDALEIPYRVLDIAAGDLGSSAARKFDCEAWLPSQGTYREVTSTSNCTDYQARRLGIRVRTEAGVRPAATLNGTLCAVGRTIVALLENHQRPDGSVRVPDALVPHLGLDELVPASPRPA